jgi:hypothetical protein
MRAAESFAKRQQYNETNPNKTKEFDLRQEDSVVYSVHTRASQCEHTQRKNVQKPSVSPIAGVGQASGARSNR